MDTISYAYADEAHTRIDELELVIADMQNTDVLLQNAINALEATDINLQIALDNISAFNSHTQDVDTIIGIEEYVKSVSPLIIVTEGEKTGYRLFGTDLENYGTIGTNAIDLSFSNDLYSLNGAIGDYSVAIGEGTVATNSHSFVTGKHNIGKEDTVLEVGVGTSDTSRSNAFEVYEDGRVAAPLLTNDKVLDDSTLITKQYIDLQLVQSLVGLTTIEKTEIIDDEITLPKVALGDIVFNSAMIYDDLSSTWFIDVTCTLSEDKTRVLFDSDDNLNNKFCVLTYLTFTNI